MPPGSPCQDPGARRLDTFSAANGRRRSLDFPLVPPAPAGAPGPRSALRRVGVRLPLVVRPAAVDSPALHLHLLDHPASPAERGAHRALLDLPLRGPAA